MAPLKPIPFEQVRVRTDLDSAQAGARFAARLHTPGRSTTAFQWGRLPQPATQPQQPAPDAAELVADHATEASPEPAAHAQQSRQGTRPFDDSDARDAARPDQAWRQVQSDEQPSQHDAAAAPPQEAARRAKPQSASAPTSAIARSVRKATMVRSLAEAVTGLCNGEENQRLGPWDMTLPLEHHGLGSSALNLRLSVGDLLLRFHCDGSAVLDLISSSAERLGEQLQASLHPPLEVRIEMALC